MLFASVGSVATIGSHARSMTDRAARLTIDSAAVDSGGAGFDDGAAAVGAIVGDVTATTALGCAGGTWDERATGGAVLALSGGGDPHPIPDETTIPRSAGNRRDVVRPSRAVIAPRSRQWRAASRRVRGRATRRTLR